MWHLRTKQGVFWVIEHVSDGAGVFRLGIDDLELGTYKDPKDAIKDVCEQVTGHLQWDCQTSIKAPKDIADWRSGQPEDWN